MDSAYRSLRQVRAVGVLVAVVVPATSGAQEAPHVILPAPEPIHLRQRNLDAELAQLSSVVETAMDGLRRSAGAVLLTTSAPHDDTPFDLDQWRRERAEVETLLGSKVRLDHAIGAELAFLDRIAGDANMTDPSTIADLISNSRRDAANGDLLVANAVTALHRYR